MDLTLQIANRNFGPTPKMVQGSHAQVEELLRAWFPDETNTVPAGDLLTVIREISRSYGIEMRFVGGTMPVEMPHLHPQRIADPNKQDFWK